MVRKLLPILGITFIDIVGFSILIPTLPYFVTHFGATPFVVGILASVFSICTLISGPIWGNVSDRIGRKAVLMISQIGATLGWVMLAFAPNIVVVFIARIIEGASGGNIGVTQAYVADLVDAKDRSRAFGLIGATFGAGMFFGPIIGYPAFKWFGFPGPFLAAATLQLATLAITWFMLPSSRKPLPDDEEKVGAREILATLGNAKFRPILLQKAALSLSLYGWYIVIALYLNRQLGFGLGQTFLAFMAFAAVGVLANVFGVGKVSKTTGDYRMANVGIALLVAAFASVPFIHAAWGLAANMGLFALGQSLANAGVTAQISNTATTRDQGTVLGVSSSLDSFAGIVAPPLSTEVMTRFGSPFAGVVSLAFAAISLGIGIFVPHRIESHDGVAAEVAAEI